jgi:glycosyltransferase involved in cell wall biosynthesis
MTNDASAPTPGLAATVAHAAGTTQRPVLFQWEVSSRFGWGIYGLNLMLAWARDPEVVALTSCELRPNQLDLSDAQRAVLNPLFERSRALQAALSHRAGRVVQVATPVLAALGNHLQHGRSAHDTQLSGRPTVAIPFIEDTHVPEGARAAAKERYALWVAGSDWNARLLDGLGLGPVATVMQGVDTALFRPGPRSGRFQGRFVVFSGGKLEHRKGQDLVLLAFRAFAQRHDDAVLLTAWHSPWPKIARGVEVNSRIAPVVFDARGRVDVAAWAGANSIPPGQVSDVGSLPNWRMAAVLREADVAIFPNRAEGGTNLVAMECLACGVPAIVAANTGQVDLLASEGCLPLRRQAPVEVSGLGTAGWGESDVEEIVEALETLYRDREAARTMGARGAAFMARHDWANQMALLKESIRPYWS